MNPLNLASSSAPPPVASDLLAKRKRGRPRKDETFATQQETLQVTPKPVDVNLVGQMVSGVVEGSFDAGYLLNVKVNDSDIKLRGVVFVPGKVTPITPENDLAPTVKMFGRDEETKNQTDDVHQSAPPPPNDQPMEDAAVTDMDISESARALTLLSQESNGKELAAQAKEKEKEGEAATRLVEFFPTPETTVVTDPPSLVLSAQKETTEPQKPSGETSGFGLMVEKEKVPEELQLELGNKTVMSGEGSNNNGIGMEIDPKPSASKSGFIANLFEGEGKKKADCDMEVEEATPSVP
ncbi:unnamed protein product [Microthlaspi erraticum]|uniref:AT hook motif-containing protein n=1 Tax=Microthlaspi erraticum TaxID=1685480 RepID=A0A6D2L450_9BRAS|nr:unnamed protein product [Microthlaspi erraticum]CAA7054721.1 unnamed protein product [Microthlaspi erraticum]